MTTDLDNMMLDARLHGSALLYAPGTRYGFEMVPQPGDGPVESYPCDEETNDGDH
jgi:hypothetical protein